MNVALLEKIIEAIQAQPEKFDMSRWFNRLQDENDNFCGTTQCIGGWALVLGMSIDPIEDIYYTENDGSRLAESANGEKQWINDIAQKVLDLSFCQADRLFHVMNWNEKFMRDYDDAQTPEEKAAVAVARIRHFIATEGRE